MVRVVQWATGKHGRELLPFLIRNPDIDLVGVYVYAAEKEGLDAGTLCGLPDTGIRATRSIADIVALRPDVVLHCPKLELTPDKSDEEVLALLRAGINVVSLRGYQAPWLFGEDYARKFEDAGRDGQATLYGTGVEPGFIYDWLAPTLTGLCTGLRAIHLDQWFDLRSRPLNTIFNICFMNARPEDLSDDAPIVKVVLELYREEFALIAAYLGTELATMSVRTEGEIAPDDVVFDQGRIERGRLWGVTFRYEARLASGVSLTLVTRWFVAPIPGWETEDSFGIVLEGEPSLSMRIAFENKFASAYDPFHRAVAAHAINMIPAVCAAEPGLMRVRPFTARGPLLAALDRKA